MSHLPAKRSMKYMEKKHNLPMGNNIIDIEKCI